MSRAEWMKGICLIWSKGRLNSPSLPVGDDRYLNLRSQKRPTGRNLRGNRLVRRSGATSSLYIACKMWKITALVWETGRKIPYLHFPCIILYIIGLRSMKLQNEKNIFARNPERRTQKQAQKDMNEMEWHKVNYLIFSAMRKRKRHVFCHSSIAWKTTRAQQGVWSLK